MDPRLESFLTLCGTMHYGRAAERLNLSQPAVSKHIQSLESQYGVTLFSYANRRLHQTKQGEILEQYAQSLRYNEAALVEKLHERPKRTLRIGATKSIGEYVLLPYIQRFLNTPGNQIEYLVDNTAHLLALLNRGELDFAVLEGLFDKQHYDWMLFQNEPYIGICAQNHPFAGAEVHIPQLLHERIILRENGSGTRKILERELQNSGYTVDAFSSLLCISSFEIIKELVRGGYGISFLYEAVVKKEADIGHFRCPPLTGVHEFNAVFLKNTEAGKIVRQFLFPKHEA